MNAQHIVKNFLAIVTPSMHARRREALNACMLSIMSGNKLTVTSMGRGIHSKAYEKHNIKRADRLCSNPHLHLGIQSIYGSIVQLLIGNNRHPVIHVDWPDMDAYGKHFLIRASLAFQGRSLTLYEEVHPLKNKEKPAVHQAFLVQLKHHLSIDCKPIIVTDADFRGPWFKLVYSLGWDFVGRVRNVTFCRPSQGVWFACKALYKLASSSPKAYEDWELNRSNPIDVNFVLYKGKPKGRHAINRKGKVKKSGASKSSSSGATDPWLLATSLNIQCNRYKKIVKIYASRMQIEEAFRDQKSARFGIGMEQHYCNNARKLKCLLLIGTLALLCLILLGIATELSDLTKRFMANTSKMKTLSYAYLGRRVFQSHLFRIYARAMYDAIEYIRSRTMNGEYATYV